MELYTIWVCPHSPKEKPPKRQTFYLGALSRNTAISNLPKFEAPFLFKELLSESESLFTSFEKSHI